MALAAAAGRPHIHIVEVLVYRVELPLYEGSYKWSGGRSVDVFDSTIVQLRTNRGIDGLGEVTPLGPAYLPAYAEGVRTGIQQLVPHILGEDPTQVVKMNEIMDGALMGHEYVKSAIDIACWDILGKLAEQPVCVLLGGRFGQTLPLYRAISQEDPESMAARVAEYREQGYHRFQLKAGGTVAEDVARIRAVASVLDTSTDTLIVDANRGWSLHDAARVLLAIKDLDVYVEQPCRTYAECLAVRRRTSQPFILDESIDSIEALLLAHKDGAMDCVNIKISKLGGLTKARQLRDLCVSLGYAMIIEDTWGSDVATAAIAHLAQSTPERALFATTDFNSYVTLQTARGAPVRNAGTIKASTEVGLGIELKMDTVGEPVFAMGI
ncbi:L-Ala-D/L-amino acid epimerase [Hondaea fermentalgiana]|uniref:L-Ala-D/L-amino acid epimerase n=1 Tax=Hondaea fermentalgiana TaxID=2315210 RepID=A0A2R5G5R0_9STRA|nr:L-Ala-D/L-amino acid epimerase [Hondaea fermentalgiana]|eukprot:GBG26377.1 L-Ala-D/L-amino acid epimerase [Hondaea fermentalgiana]